MKAIKILVLESKDSSINKIVEILKNSFQVEICVSNDEFLDHIYNNIYDLYLININEKNLPRIELIKLLNDYQDLTMKLVVASIFDIVKPSFLSGCDECIIKSIDEVEIILRVKALIRRQFRVYTDSIYLTKNIEYEIFNKRVLLNKVDAKLGSKAICLLDYLLKYRGHFVSTNSLEKSIYPVNSSSKNSSIRFHIFKLRKLIGEELIISHRNYGYKIDI